MGANYTIAKNTAFLYIRLIITILINLYSIRLLWRTLGVDDYGIYNLVGGVVAILSFLNSSMVGASQRYISYALGVNNFNKLVSTFRASIKAHNTIAVLVFIIGETLGLWFLNYKLNIPENRIFAANIVFQASLFSFICSIISVPYNACVVAHEHMKMYGYIGIIEVFIKFFCVLITYWLNFDKLITYSLLVLLCSFTICGIYIIYCRRKFEECITNGKVEKPLFKEMLNFGKWTFIGTMGITLKDQGINIILNLFFNVAVNAAKSVANSVGSVISGFAGNFTMAINPQITKRYAAGEIPSMLSLMFNGSKYSLILISLFAIPLLLSAQMVMNLWLDDVAPYTIGFLQLTLIVVLIDSVVSPITASIQATGDVKKFQLVISFLMLMNLPFAWISLSLYKNPYMVMYIVIITSVIALFSRLLILRSLINFSIRKFLKTVYLRTIPCLTINLLIVYMIHLIWNQGFLDLMVFGVVSLLAELFSIYIVALNKTEKTLICNFISSKLKLTKHK